MVKKENILHASCLESKVIWERFHKPDDRGYCTDNPRCMPRPGPPLKKERYQSCLSLLTFTRQCWYQIQKDKKEKVKLKYWVNRQPTVIDWGVLRALKTTLDFDQSYIARCWHFFPQKMMFRKNRIAKYNQKSESSFINMHTHNTQLQ